MNMNVSSNYSGLSGASRFPGIDTSNGTQSDPRASRAAGALASYMHENGTETLDPDKLEALATNGDGQTPPGVRKAAQYMLDNPDVWKQIETNDVSTPDGISGVGNLDKAAQGDIPLTASQALDGASEPEPDIDTDTDDGLDAGDVDASTQGDIDDGEPANPYAASQTGSPLEGGAGPTIQPPSGDDTPQASGTGDGGLGTAPQTQALTDSQTKQVEDQYKANLMSDFGLTDAQASGIVGNLMQESGGMNSGINQGGQIGGPSGNMADDNANGYGIAQWGGTRKQGLIDTAAANGLDPSSEAANYLYLKQELSGSYSSAIDAVKGTSDVAGATQAFSDAYEQPSDPDMGARIAYAQQAAG